MRAQHKYKQIAWGITNVISDFPVTDPHFWTNEEEFTIDTMKHIFRSATDEEMPLLKERYDSLRESGRVLYEVRFGRAE